MSFLHVRIWLDGDNEEDSSIVIKKDYWNISDVVEDACDKLYNDSAGEAFNKDGSTILWAREVDEDGEPLGEPEKYSVWIDWEPIFLVTAI